jgi:hypothetical protein
MEPPQDTDPASDADPERRAAPRVPVRMRVRVRIDPPYGGSLTGWTVNLSLSGVYVACRKAPPPGTTCGVFMIGRQGDTILRHTGRARVARVDDGGLGLEFVDLTPDDVQALQRLADLQTGP